MNAVTATADRFTLQSRNAYRSGDIFVDLLTHDRRSTSSVFGNVEIERGHVGGAAKTVPLVRSHVQVLLSDRCLIVIL